MYNVFITYEGEDQHHEGFVLCVVDTHKNKFVVHGPCLVTCHKEEAGQANVSTSTAAKIHTFISLRFVERQEVTRVRELRDRDLPHLSFRR